MDLKLTRDQAERRATRKSLVRTADRSEKVRTYNYPQVCHRTLYYIISIQHAEQNRVTDHRLGKGNMVSCEATMEGDGLRTLIDELRDRHMNEALQEVLEGYNTV
jgi:peptide chain release factor 1